MPVVTNSFVPIFTQHKIPRWSHRHANVRNQRKCFPSETGRRQDELVGRKKFGERNHWKQHRVAGDTVITESKQNIPWKGNCPDFHSWKFCFAFSVQIFFTDQNANIINPSEITFFQIFSSVMGYRKQHCVAGDTVITESKQNISWKGNCLYFHSWKFRFGLGHELQVSSLGLGVFDEVSVSSRNFNRVSVSKVTVSTSQTYFCWMSQTYFCWILIKFEKLLPKNYFSKLDFY